MPERVDTVLVGDKQGVDNIAERFAHLLACQGDHSVAEYLPREREPGRKEHRLKHRRLLTQIIFARKVRHWPPLFEHRFVFGPPDRREIRDKRIEPNIHDVRIVARYGNPPREFLFRARNAEILETSLDESGYLVKARSRHDEIWMRFVVLQERILVFREPEKVVLLLTSLDLKVGGERALAVNELRIGLFKLAPDAVLHLVVGFVDIARSLRAAPHLLRGRLVLRVSRPQKDVMRDREAAGEGVKLLRIKVNECFWHLMRLLGAFRNLRAVLISAYIEKNLIAARAKCAHEAIGLDKLERVTQVRVSIHIREGRGEVAPHFFTAATRSRRPRSTSLINSCKIATSGTERRMPKKPAISAPAIRPTMTRRGGTPTIFFTTKG